MNGKRAERKGVREQREGNGVERRQILRTKDLMKCNNQKNFN